MSIATQNLLRQIGSGYGGTGTNDPYSIYGALLGEAAGELQSRKYNEQLNLEKQNLSERQRQFDVSEKRLQSQLDNMIKEANTRTMLQLAQSGFGKQSELNKFGQGFGLSYEPATTQLGTGLMGSSGGASGGKGGTGDLGSLLQTYQSLAPYSSRLHSGFMYDPTLSKLRSNISNVLLGYGR